MKDFKTHTRKPHTSINAPCFLSQEGATKKNNQKMPLAIKVFNRKKTYFRVATKWFLPGFAQMASLPFASKIRLL
jgi:hypothetical protein